MESPLNKLDRLDLSGPQIEYAMLREETLKRIESRQQTLSITLTLAGAFLGVGWGTGGAVALLIFPPLAALLAISWSQNEIRIRQLNAYIRDHLETSIPGLGYERFRRQEDMQSRVGNWPLDVFAIGGIFLLTQGMAVGLGIFRFSSTLIEWVLLGVDLIAIGLLLVVLNYVRRHAMR